MLQTIKNMSEKTKKILQSVILGTLISFLLFYIFLPPINIQAAGFWWYLAFVILSYSLPFLFKKKEEVKKRRKKAPTGIEGKLSEQLENVTLSPLWASLIAAPLCILLLASILFSPVFFAQSYAKVITVKDAVFETDMPETNEVTNIALMDTDSAVILGNRTLGALSHVVSQYDVWENYSQINYHGTPKKVANLEYDGFFKWLGNQKNGVPGMVMVDPVKNDAEYIEFSEPLHYVESAYFNQDLERRLRFLYPTKIFQHISFELNEDGKPYFVVACSAPKVGLFGAYDIAQVILFDPVSGTGELLAVEETPAWVDIVYDGYLACEKYNWLGLYTGGFINSLIGNVGCKQATDDFGYLVLEDDVWYFTGVTSVSADKSNIGFILSNARTGEYKFYPVIGAEEHSAMEAAQGEVQEKGYVASFPSLINVAGQPTYIMVLKDDAGLVKLYALVNVEKYNLVATGATQNEAMTAYKKLLKQNDIQTDTGTEAAIAVADVRILNVSDVSTVYITAEDGVVYKGFLETDERFVLIRKGDRLTVFHTPSEVEGIQLITDWRFAESAENG